MSFDLAREKAAAEKAIRNISTEGARQRLLAELESLLVQQVTATGPAKAEIESRINQLRRDAEIAAGVNLWSWASILLMATIVILYFGGIYMYMAGLGPERYSSIEATRPILVFTLIVAMLGFGGLLIVAALFSNDSEEHLQRKFRHAREIFLVFAGIFGTIIGFYFGAADENNGTPPSLSEPTFASGRVTVEIEGGRPPFIGMLTTDGEPTGEVIQGDGRALSFTAAEGCPANASVTVVDGEGRRDEAGLTCPTVGGGSQSENAGNATGALGDTGAPGNTADQNAIR
jgi:hypothetical protein